MCSGSCLSDVRWLPDTRCGTSHSLWGHPIHLSGQITMRGSLVAQDYELHIREERWGVETNPSRGPDRLNSSYFSRTSFCLEEVRGSTVWHRPRSLLFLLGGKDDDLQPI